MTSNNCRSLANFAPWRLCAAICLLISSSLIASVLIGEVRAADNELSADEQADGWVLLI